MVNQYTNLLFVPFISVVHYLKEAQTAIETKTKLHHMKLKAAHRRCFVNPFFDAPTTHEKQVRTLQEMLGEMRWHKQGSLPQVFCVYAAMKFSLEILKTKHGEESAIEKETRLATVMMERAEEIHKSAVANLTGNDPDHDHPLYKEFFAQLILICEEMHELYSSLMVPEYQKTKCVEFTNMFKEELMQKTCHPSRVQWWMDVEEYAEIFGTV